MGAFAEASFREGHNDAHLWSVTAWGETEDDALEKLLVELRQRYTTTDLRAALEALYNATIISMDTDENSPPIVKEAIEQARAVLEEGG